jgi:hypothetical protein
MDAIADDGAGQARMAALEAELAELRRELAALRAEVRTEGPGARQTSDHAPAAASMASPIESGGTDEPRRPVSRRGLIAGAAGAVAAGAAAAVATATPAAANSQGQSWTLGDTTNSATSSTWLRAGNVDPVLLITNNGTSKGNACQFYVHESTNSGAVTHHETAGSGPGIEVVSSNPSNTTPALDVATGHAGSAGRFTVQNSANSATALAVSTSGSGTALTASAKNGNGAFLSATGSNAALFVTMSGTGNGAFINHTSTTSANPTLFVQTTAPSPAIRAKGPVTNLNLWPRTTTGAPTGDTVAHNGGDLVEDSTGALWVCVSSGTPGQWRKLAGPTTAGALHVLPAPVRIYDSRAGTSPAVGQKAKLQTNVARTVDLTVNNSGVPAGALAAMVTILIVDAQAGSANFTLWKNGATRPASNTMVWGGSTGRFSTLAVTALDSAGKAQVLSSVPTNVVLDVVGYYR